MESAGALAVTPSEAGDGTAPASVRLTRLAGLASIVAWVAWLSARFAAEPFWPMSGARLAAILLWSLGIHAVLRITEALTRPGGWSGYARAYALLLFCGGTFLFYMNAHRVGPVDAQWYENMTTDALLQMRSGTFPVTLGSTVYAFNGAVHPFRSAPWEFVLAGGVDVLSGRALAPVAVEHLTAIMSFCAAVLILFVGFARARPQAKGTAWLFALCYAMLPAATVPFFQYDMYMTITAQPVIAAALLCLRQAVEEDSIVASSWLGVFLAALWYCHPPMALMTNLVCGSIAAGAVAVRGITLRRLAGGCRRGGHVRHPGRSVFSLNVGAVADGGAPPGDARHAHGRPRLVSFLDGGVPAHAPARLARVPAPGTGVPEGIPADARRLCRTLLRGDAGSRLGDARAGALERRLLGRGLCAGGGPRCRPCLSEGIDPGGYRRLEDLGLEAFFSSPSHRPATSSSRGICCG